MPIYGYSPYHFTFHSCLHSGTTLVYDSHVPPRCWTVCGGTSKDSAYSEGIAMSLARLVNTQLCSYLGVKFIFAQSRICVQHQNILKVILYLLKGQPSKLAAGTWILGHPLSTLWSGCTGLHISFAPVISFH